MKDVPTKHDGTADMRYKESQDAVASGIITKDEVLVDESVKVVDIPIKNDGTADMRFKASQAAVASGTIDNDEDLTGKFYNRFPWFKNIFMNYFLLYSTIEGRWDTGYALQC